MPTKNLLEQSSLFCAIVVSVLILILSLISVKNMPNLSYNYIDKYEHLIAYATLSFFWMLSKQAGKIKIRTVHLFLAMLIYGVLIEILQSQLTTYRTGDFFDVLANTLGLLVGFGVLKLLNRIYLHV